MHSEWLAMEHHRLHIIEEWTDGPHKDAAFRAIQSSIASLTRRLPPGIDVPDCEVCAARKALPEVLNFPYEALQNGTSCSDLAA